MSEFSAGDDGESLTAAFRRPGTNGLGREIGPFTKTTGRTILLRTVGTARNMPPSSTPQVMLQVGHLIRCLDGERTRVEILQRPGLNDRTHPAKEYLRPAIAEGLVEMTIPDKPRSSKQQYCLTGKGRKQQTRLKRAE